MADGPLTATEIRQNLREVANELGPQGPEHAVILVGGALLALHDLRPSTHDVDTVEAMDDELQAAVAAVARRHDLSPRWLNSDAKAYTPSGFDPAESRMIVRYGRLHVRAAPFRQVFLMKLYAARAPDYDDMVRLWPHTGFQSPQQAVAAYQEAYPHAPEDEHLQSYVEQIATEAEQIR